MKENNVEENKEEEYDIEKKKKKKIIKKKMVYLERIEDLTIPQNNCFMLGDFLEAIKVTKDIIELAKEGNLPSIVKEQEEYIRKCELLIEKRKLTKEINTIYERLKTQFINLTEQEKIFQAHNLIIDFKKKYGTKVKLESISDIRALFIEEKENWEEFKKKQDTIKKDLAKLEKRIINSLDSYDLKSVEQILNESKNFLKEIYDDDILKKWSNFEERYIHIKDLNQLKRDIANVISECKILKENKRYTEARIELTSIIQKLKNKDLPEQLKKLENIKNDISTLEEIYNTKIKNLQELEKKLEESQNNNHILRSISICKNIIKLVKEIEDKDKESKYNQLSDNLKTNLKESEELRKNQISKFIEKAKELNNIIETDEDILPIIDKYSVKKLVGDLSDDKKEMFKQINSLLDHHRVEIKNEILNKYVLTSASGEIIELKKKINIRNIKENDNESDKISSFQVISGFENSFNDIIKEGILTDLIPYNFELTNIELNGNPVDQGKSPKKTLTGSGLELIWNVQEVKKKEKFEITYKLQKRISRTIIFIIENQINLIKTHSNIENREIEGHYDVKMHFNNRYGKQLESIVIEDIIPNYFINIIIEPKNIKPKKITKSNSSNLIKWNIGPMAIEKVKNHYGLLELHKYGKLKEKITKLNNHGLDDLEKGNLVNSFKNFINLKELLVVYIE